MNLEEIKAKEERGEGLTVEEIKFLRENVKPVKHVYGKYGTLAKIYLEENRWEKVASLGKDYPEYLHEIDRQADEYMKLCMQNCLKTKGTSVLAILWKTSTGKAR